MKNIRLEIPLGYKVEEEKRRVSFSRAQRELASKQREKITFAEKQDDSMLLTSHRLICPYCGHKIPAYGAKLNQAFGDLFTAQPTQTAGLKRWASAQTCLFATESCRRVNQEVYPTVLLVCPHCKNDMKRSDQIRIAEIARKRHKITVRAEVQDPFELCSLPYLNGRITTQAFPLYEVVCFNFKKGRTFVRLETADGAPLAVRDITCDFDEQGSGVVQKLVLKHKMVQRALRDVFDKEWQSPIPFYPSELNVGRLKLLTQFVGYDRRFYSAIPFDGESMAIEESFRSIAAQMRKTHGAIRLYHTSALPNMKSVKKVVFDNAGLFFYLEECERLWQILQDPNYFVGLLKKAYIYEILSDLHIHPAVFSFLEDYVKAGRVRHLFKMLPEFWREIRRYGVDYSAMSVSARKKEQVKWGDRKREYVFRRLPDFSIPMGEPQEQIRDCTIDGFTFSWLKSSVDYRQAGKRLHNCLTAWRSNNSPVVSVHKNGNIVAAIEVRNGAVVQAFTAHNQKLGNVRGLAEAYYKWYTKYALIDRRRRNAVDVEFDENLLPEIENAFWL